MQALRLQVQGATQQRMLREIAEAIEVGTVRRPLVLIFEDLHWSDSAWLNASTTRLSLWRPTLSLGTPCSFGESLPRPESMRNRGLPSTAPRSTVLADPIPSVPHKTPG